MSDLISRSALIKHLTGRRLQECPVGICDEETERYKTICECIKSVEEQPTACDLESVVAELKNEIEWAKNHGTGEDFRKGRISGLRTAIRVAGNGGVK